MHLSPLDWQDLNVSYPFKRNYTEKYFLDFQENTLKALALFQKSNVGSALIIKSELLPEYITEFERYFKQYNIAYSFLNEFNRQTLFGYRIYLEKENSIKFIEGKLSGIDNGVLIININALLLDITQWDKLKQALLFGEFEVPDINAVPAAPSKVFSRFKLTLIGSRDDIATLAEYDDTLYQFANYAEINSYLNLNEENIQQWADYIQTQSKHLTQRNFSVNGLNQFLNNAIRESESQELVSISPDLLKKQLLGLQTFYANANEFDDINAYFSYLEQQSAVLNQYALKDILSNQLYLETEDETIGQINGLSVVEFDGVPHAFGEPIRISCNVQYGDGEIHDIERKVELGGNIHSKGIFIAQSCLANLLELPTQLPFSASIAFEQSYSEIDGDSSSLAIFCLLISALTKLPVPQSFAMTGAIDQFGNVLSVGGVNQKIEGFFNVCQARGLTGKQGVIIPANCVSHLSLRAEVIEAVKQGQFSVWAVNDVFDATELLFQRPFYQEDEKPSPETTLFDLAHQYMESQNEGASGSIFAKFCKWLRK